jgi:hypothetical protein
LPTQTFLYLEENFTFAHRISQSSNRWLLSWESDLYGIKHYGIKHCSAQQPSSGKPGFHILLGYRDSSCLTVKVHYKPTWSGACISRGMTQGDQPEDPGALRLSRLSQTLHKHSR